MLCNVGLQENFRFLKYNVEKGKMIQAGDLVLIKKITGFHFMQEGICWWLNSKHSHAEGILTEDGYSMNFTMKFNKTKMQFYHTHVHNIEIYFQGHHRITILRPTGITKEQQDKFVNSLLNKVGTKYALLEYLGFLSNKVIDDPTKWHCCSGTLQAYHDAGMFLKRNMDFISPASFEEWSCFPQIFEIIFDKDKPTEEDFINLKK